MWKIVEDEILLFMFDIWCVFIFFMIYFNYLIV